MYCRGSWRDCRGYSPSIAAVNRQGKGARFLNTKNNDDLEERAVILPLIVTILRKMIVPLSSAT